MIAVSSDVMTGATVQLGASPPITTLLTVTGISLSMINIKYELKVSVPCAGISTE